MSLSCKYLYADYVRKYQQKKNDQKKQIQETLNNIRLSVLDLNTHGITIYSTTINRRQTETNYTDLMVEELIKKIKLTFIDSVVTITTNGDDITIEINWNPDNYYTRFT